MALPRFVDQRTGAALPVGVPLLLVGGATATLWRWRRPLFQCPRVLVQYAMPGTSGWFRWEPVRPMRSVALVHLSQPLAVAPRYQT